MSPKRGAKAPTLATLTAKNEQRHRDALARGSRYAAATERRRQQLAAQAAQTTPTPPGDATPPPDAQPPAAPARRRAGPSPDYAALTGPARLTLGGIGRILWDEGIEGLLRLARSKS